MVVLAIFVIGWRSDAGAYLLDIYPQEKEIHPQDLMNLFSLHRMGANNDLSKAVANFNFLRIDQGILVSWYSGFQSTRFIGKPNYCVGLLLDLNDNVNKWELSLEKLTYNVLMKLDDPNRHAILTAYYQALKKDYEITALPGFVSQYDEQTNISMQTQSQQITESPVSDKNEFDDLLNLVETSTSSSFSSENKYGSDPFSSSTTTSDPFSSSSAQIDPFSQSSDFSTQNPFAQTQKSSFESKGITSNTNASSGANVILAELNKIDRTNPKDPGSSNFDQKVAFYQKKVEFLENKISVLLKLVQELQAKEDELAEKNDIIGKLLRLLS